MAEVIWPRTLMPKRPSVFERPRSLSGAANLAGATIGQSVDIGIWSFSYDQFTLTSIDLQKLWRALGAQIEGRSNVIVLPIFPCGSNPGGFASAGVDEVPFSDDSPFDDDSLFSQPKVYALAGGAAAKRATQISINMLSGEALTPGEYFSIGDRLYIIKSIVDVVGTVTTVNIWPNLREAITADQDIDFSTPRCRARLQTDNEMDLEATDLRKWAFPSARFVEDPR